MQNPSLQPARRHFTCKIRPCNLQEGILRAKSVPATCRKTFYVQNPSLQVCGAVSRVTEAMFQVSGAVSRVTEAMFQVGGKVSRGTEAMFQVGGAVSALRTACFWSAGRFRAARKPCFKSAGRFPRRGRHFYEASLYSLHPFSSVNSAIF